MELKAKWGYGTKKDLEKWTAHICETCVDKKLDFVKFKIEELKLNSYYSTDTEQEEMVEKASLFLSR